MKSVFLFFLFLLSVLAHAQEFSFVSKEYHKLTDTEIAVIVSEKRISKPVKYLEDGTLITDELAASLELTKNGYKYKQILFGD
jgi:Na+/H+ antiporter NhaA